ncbi:hypothetical protein BDZ94DRAFT_1301941 [Collybia nuda]|uniref:Uncharacterized protein n=1 Tax=Collybia nuda TaxID=64659 RepID=A0A9P5XXB3_9AGAR|nr:hypothetical protein BDZ94DRAFT_1301941 [Collybia nuda]
MFLFSIFRTRACRACNGPHKTSQNYPPVPRPSEGRHTVNERSLAEEKGTGGQYNQAKNELQQLRAENAILQRISSKYMVEIRGFIKEREKLEERNSTLQDENKMLLQEQEVKDIRIVWLSREWSTARALRLKLHRENQQLLQELKNTDEKVRNKITRELRKKTTFQVLVNARRVRLRQKHKLGNIGIETSRSEELSASDIIDISEDLDLEAGPNPDDLSHTPLPIDPPSPTNKPSIFPQPSSPWVF